MDISLDPARNIIRVTPRRSWPTQDEYLTALADIASVALTDETSALLDFRDIESGAFAADEEMRLCSRLLSPQLPARRAYLTRDDLQHAAALGLQETAGEGVSIGVFREEQEALDWLTGATRQGGAEPRGFDRRQHERFVGPFDGVRMGALETPLQLFDLSVGGCFVNSMHEQQEGVTFKLRVDLPGEAGVLLRAETLYRRPGGYAVRFVDVDAATCERLRRGLENWKNAGA